LKINVLLLSIIIQISLVACKENPSPVLNSDKLLQTDIEFAKLSSDSGAAYAFKSYLAGDALMLPAGSYPVMGLDSIFASMSKSDGTYKLLWDPQKAEVAKSGELGWTWGKYTMSYLDEKGMEVNSYGKYLNIWKLNSEGNWKVLVDMGNKSPGKE
jgi:ketosteroid isomerase-like protein